MSEEGFYMSPEKWAEHWEKNGSKAFHLPHVCGLLTKYKDRLVAGRDHVKILFPFCGKAVDMKWLADLGHTIVGCDCAPLAFKEFFEEQKVEYTTKKVDDFTVYTSKDEKLIMYCGDFLKFASKHEGQFDAIWDRGALFSVNECEKEAYTQLMMTLMKPDCQYFVSVNDCEDEKTREEWGLLTDEKLIGYFGEKCDLQLRVEYVPVRTYDGDLIPDDMAHFMEKLTVITLKK